MRYYPSREFPFKQFASSFFAFEKNLNFRTVNNVVVRVASPTVCRKYNIYYYIINHLKNICIAEAIHRGEVIKGHKL